MTTHQHIQNGLLDLIFKGNANIINSKWWDHFDPEGKTNEGGIFEKKIGSKVTKESLKEWEKILKEHNITRTTLKEINNYFKNRKNLRFDQIYNLHLKDDRVLVMDDDATMFYKYKNLTDYPVYLLNVETAEKMVLGYHILNTIDPKKIPVGSQYCNDFDTPDINQIIVAASYHEIKKEIKIEYKNIKKIQKIVRERIRKELFNNDEYYNSSTNIIERFMNFVQDHDIVLIHHGDIYNVHIKDLVGDWTVKNSEFNYCHFKNLHLFDLKSKRPSCGWICVPIADPEFEFDNLNDLNDKWEYRDTYDDCFEEEDRFAKYYMMVPKNLVISWI